MDPEFKYPRWQRLLEAAILEFDPVQLYVRLREVEVAIASGIRGSRARGTSDVLGYAFPPTACEAHPQSQRRKGSGTYQRTYVAAPSSTTSHHATSTVRIHSL